MLTMLRHEHIVADFNVMLDCKYSWRMISPAKRIRKKRDRTLVAFFG